MSKKKKPQPGDHIHLTESQQEALTTIFKTYDAYRHTVRLFSDMLKDEQERAWDTVFELFPQYKDWNVRWDRKDKLLELIYPKST